MPELSLSSFIERWKESGLTERSAAQSHFIDVCHLLDQLTPAEADPTGDFYAFERGVTKVGGGEGFADVWKRGFFAWEYKGKHKNLSAAYQQLLQYREDLENPPLLVVCDLVCFEVHTNFTNAKTRVYRFSLDDLADPAPRPETCLSALDILRAVFTNPESLHPKFCSNEATWNAAAQATRLVESLGEYGNLGQPTVLDLLSIVLSFEGGVSKFSYAFEYYKRRWGEGKFQEAKLALTRPNSANQEAILVETEDGLQINHRDPRSVAADLGRRLFEQRIPHYRKVRSDISFFSGGDLFLQRLAEVGPDFNGDVLNVIRAVLQNRDGALCAYDQIFDTVTRNALVMHALAARRFDTYRRLPQLEEFMRLEHKPPDSNQSITSSADSLR